MHQDRRFNRIKPAGNVSRTASIILDPKSPVIGCNVWIIPRAARVSKWRPASRCRTDLNCSMPDPKRNAALSG